MLSIVAITLGLCAVGVLLVAVGAREITRRLGLEPLQVLLWLGIAEQPIQKIPRRRLQY